MSLLYNKLIKSIKTAIYESLFDDIDDDIVTDNDNESLIDTLIGGYKFVDLDLPSGTLWCDRNLGAKNEMDPGNYYQWGYTEPVKEGITLLTKTDYTKFNPSGNNRTFTKYNKNKVHYQLEDIDDAAYQEYDGVRRIPTPELFEELIKYCNWKYVNGIHAYKITSKKRGNTEFIYLPAGGFINETCELLYHRLFGDGMYWTSYNTSNPELNYVKPFKNNLKAFAQCLYFRCSEYISEAPHIENFSRFIAANIRPVINNN